MPHQPSTVRGPGSNQHQDKPPQLHHQPDDQARRAAAAAAVTTEPDLDGTSSDVQQRSEQLTAAMKKILADGKVVEYLRLRGENRNYSPFNTMLLRMQQPDAQGVWASYATWKQLGRQVRKGEKAAGIWIPMSNRRLLRGPEGKPKLDADGNRQYVSTGQPNWLWRNAAFDISQTDGPEYAPPRPEPIEDVDPERIAALRSAMQNRCEQAGISIEMKELPPGLYGHYQRATETVVLNSSSSPADQAATLAHELAHAFDPELQGDDHVGVYKHTRADCEAVAEGTAHVIAGRFGIDLSGYSGGYLAGYLGNDPDRLGQLVGRIEKITDQMLGPSETDAKLTEAKQAAEQQAKTRKKKAKKKPSKRTKKGT